jgi:hypothetical protein
MPKAAAPPPPPEKNLGPYWFQVKYGRSEAQLFNSDCLAKLLADHIKRQCGYGHLAETIDLQREDKSMVGLLKGAGEEGAEQRRASEMLAAKGVYSLCKLVLPENGDSSALVPELLFEEAEPAEPGSTAE